MPIPIAPNPMMTRSEEDQPQPVQGTMPDSVNEWYVALALDKLGMDYSFQYQIGIAGTRGSQVVDFIVWKGEGGYPLEIQGAYWHDARHDPDWIIKASELERIFHNPVIFLTEEETSSKEAAYKTVRDKVFL